MTATPDVRILDQRTPEERERTFLPGMGKTWLLPLYDVVTRLSRIRPLHRRAVELAEVGDGQAVLDVGCGTGSLSLTVLEAVPDARVTGLDPDGDSLRRAARKARRRSVSLTLVQGYADRLPAEDGSVDHVVSSLALHHVDEEERAGFAAEALRVLRPGGTVTIVDFGGPAHGGEPGHGQAHGHGNGDGGGHGDAAHRHGPAHFLRHLPGLLRPRARRGEKQAMPHDLGDGLIPLLAGAGFTDVREVDHAEHRFGRVSFVQAMRPTRA